MTEAATLAETSAVPAEAPISANGTALGFQLLAVAAVDASPTNPRKTFNEAKHAELTESVKQLGVLEPILVRPHPTKRGRYELVAGERRWRASKAAKLATIPAIVKDLDDLTTLEVQVVENLQRDDLHPLEEAEGYEALMKKHAFSAEQLAAKVGKSKAYIYARLKLCALSPETRKPFMEGTIDASTALLIARIPVPALQKKALGEILTGGEWLEGGGRGAMTYRRAADHVRARYMLRLDGAPFDVKALYFAKNKANPVGPACAECPKRTGNAPDLFGDVQNDNVCTDPDCFGEKREAAGRQRVEEAKARGLEVFTGKEARKLMPYEHGQVAGMVKLSDHNYADEKNRTWEKLLGKGGSSGDFKAERAKAELEHKMNEETSLRAYLLIREGVGANGLTNVDLREITRAQLDKCELPDCLAKLWGLEADYQLDDAAKTIAKADGAALLQMFLDVTIGADAIDPYGIRLPDNLLKAHGIDVKAIEKAVRAELKAASKSKGGKKNAEAEDQDEGGDE